MPNNLHGLSLSLAKIFLQSLEKK